MNSSVIARAFTNKYYNSDKYYNSKGWFLVPGFGDFYDLPFSGILTTSANTPSQTSQTIGDFKDVIGRIGSISALKVLSQTVPDVGDFYDECEHEICLSGSSGMLVYCLYLLPKPDFQ